MKVKRGIRLLALAAVTAMSLSLFVACGGDDDDDGGEPATVETKGTGGATATSPSGGGNGGGAAAQTVKVSMKDNFFEPKEIKIPVNTTVKVELSNDGAAIHNMSVAAKAGGEAKDFKSDLTISAGDDDDFEMKFTKKGNFKFQCDYHVPDMVGTITVE